MRAAGLKAQGRQGTDGQSTGFKEAECGLQFVEYLKVNSLGSKAQDSGGQSITVLQQQSHSPLTVT